MISVLFFGPVADRVGASKLDVAHRAGLCLGDLRAELQRQYPEAFEIVSMTALNGVRVSDPSSEINDASEVVFMSNFSGG